ncbi:hypothetical protein ACHAWF_015219 [Thalassiosira exigua]
MVGFGDALRKSRRPGWEEAYLDYDGLKDIRNRLETALVEREEQNENAARLSFQDSTSIASDATYPADDAIHRCSTQFAIKLHNEVAKITLFILARAGDVADALGELRFRTNDSSGDAVSNRRGSSVTDEEAESVGAKKEEENRLDLDDFGERGSLLPLSDRRSHNEMSALRRSSRFSASGLFSREKLDTLIGRHYKDVEDKADIYSEIGVELIHILKFTCLNAVAVRKIVKKYDKTFLSFSHVREGRLRDVILNESSIFMPNEVVRKMPRARDDRLLQLANNQSLSSIYASLLDALVDCERAVLQSLSIHGTSDPIVFSKDAAKRLLRSPTNVSGGTALLRFECTVSSITAIQEFATDVNRPGMTFLSQRAMIGAVDGHGEQGSADNKAVDILLLFEPDLILDLNADELGHWYQRATAKVSAHRKGISSCADNPFLSRQMRDWGGVDSASMLINLSSILLYTVNYYIICPTANALAILLGVDGALGASLIGASSVAAIGSAFLYSVWYTRLSFRSALLFSAACPFIGNFLYSVALTYNSIQVALVGRFLCGFGSAEVVNRQLIASCVSLQSMTRASALFVTASALGMSIGPLIAAILDMTAGRDTDIDIQLHLPYSPKDSGIIIDHVTMPGFLMMGAWGLQLICLLVLFEEPKRINVTEDQKSGEENDCNTLTQDSNKCYGSLSMITLSETGAGDDNMSERETFLNTPANYSATPFNKRWLADSVCSLIKIIIKNAAFPVTLYLFSFIELIGEVMISSCSMIVHRYFRWNGASAGIIVSSLGFLVLPAHFIVEIGTRSYSERRILKLSILGVICGILMICNFEGLVLDLVGKVVEGSTSESEPVERWRKIVKHSRTRHNEFEYDWGAGAFIYIVSLAVIFIASIVMEGVNTSLSRSQPSLFLVSCHDVFTDIGLCNNTFSVEIDTKRTQRQIH